MYPRTMFMVFGCRIFTLHILHELTYYYVYMSSNTAMLQDFFEHHILIVLMSTTHTLAIHRLYMPYFLFLLEIRFDCFTVDICNTYHQILYLRKKMTFAPQN